MSLSPASRGSFKKLWKKHFGQEISDEQAAEYGERLIRVVGVLADPAMYQREREPP
ncbi:MAG: hypothetical protein WCV62_02590 [Candidatus Peribacteraceae bacterium]|jgi:hypothetical protein